MEARRRGKRGRETEGGFGWRRLERKPAALIRGNFWRRRQRASAAFDDKTRVALVGRGQRVSLRGLRESRVFVRLLTVARLTRRCNTCGGNCGANTSLRRPATRLYPARKRCSWRIVSSCPRPRISSNLQLKSVGAGEVVLAKQRSQSFLSVLQYFFVGKCMVSLTLNLREGTKSKNWISLFF